jgi:flagellar basal body-associated protein FliL
MSTITAVDDMFDDAERGLEWLEKLEALQTRSASDRAALEVAEYVMRLREAVTVLAGNRTAAELHEAVGEDTAQLVEELRRAGDNDYRNRKIRPILLKLES